MYYSAMTTVNKRALETMEKKISLTPVQKKVEQPIIYTYLL